MIVSLTSHPKRIATTHLAIESILNQTFKPTNIILNLASADFPDGFASLPNEIQSLIDNGNILLNFSDKNYLVATKLLPTLTWCAKKKYKKCIVTIDDDRIYHPELLETLYKRHKEYPGHIIAPYVRPYILSESRGIDYLHRDSNSSLEEKLEGLGEKLEEKLLCLEDKLLCGIFGSGKHHGRHFDDDMFGIFEGFGGVLYPAYDCLYMEVFNFDKFKQLTPFADDIWFQVMAILAGTKCIGLSEDDAKKVGNPPEIPNTQECGLFHKHLYANDLMCYKTMYHYKVLDKVFKDKSKFKSVFKCVKCARLIDISKKTITNPNSSSNSNLNLNLTLSCPVCLNDRPKRLLFVGAYGYGNIGDNIYEKIWKKLFSNSSYEICCVPDTVLVNSKGAFTDKLKFKDEYYCPDVLIIGGGGLLKDFEHNKFMRYHFDYALEEKIPIIFASIGLQLGRSDEFNVNFFSEYTKNVLKNATLILVRSLVDEQMLSSLKLRNVCYFPDASYIYVPLFKIKPKHKRYISLIQTGCANIHLPEVKDKIYDKNEKIIIQNWGGKTKPEAIKDFPEYDLFLLSKHISKQNVKSSKVYMGHGISKKLAAFRYPEVKVKGDISVKKAVQFVANSKLVITGRYHGYTIAKSMNIEVNTPIFNHKINSEKKNPDFKSKINSAYILKYIIDNYDMSLSYPDLWSEADRNYNIVELSKKVKVSVPLLQALDNEHIYKFLVSGYIEPF